MGDPTHQVHDFEPGIKPSGLFWTIPIAASAIDVAPGTGRARYDLENLALRDFHDIFNAVSPSPTSRPGHVSFDVRWAGDGDRTTIRDTTFGFVGDFVGGNIAVSFTASDDGTGVIYTSDAEGQTTISGGVGHERNGIFFS